MIDGGTAARAWADALAGWALPEHVLAQAPASPWAHPVACFEAPDGPLPRTVSTEQALEALPDGGSVLDVGCGGGRASLALVPPAGHLTGVDRSPQMLERFAASAAARGVAATTVAGRWPDVAPGCDRADVVVCHHVVYDVARLAPFALALSERARRRVVLELPARHPLAWLSPLWQRFWGLERPDGPTADDAVAVLREAGLPARSTAWTDPRPPLSERLGAADRVAHVRTRLCLAPDRDDDVASALAQLPVAPRPTVTVWWDVPE